MEPVFVVAALVAIAAIGLTMSYLLQISEETPKRKKPRLPSRPAPGPSASDPIRGNLGDIEKAGGINTFLTILHEQYGGIASFWHREQYIVSIASPELLEKYTDTFDRPNEFFGGLEGLVTSSAIFFVNGGAGRGRRSLYDSSLGEKALVNYYGHINEVGVKHVNKLSIGQKIDLKDFVLNLATHAIGRAAFGGLFDDEAQVQRLKHAYEEAVREMTKHKEGTDPSPQLLTCRNSLKSIMRDVLEDRNLLPVENNEYAIVDAILESAEAKSVQEGDAMVFLMGGLRHTSHLFTWALYYISKHPEVQERLYLEIRRNIGEREVTSEIFPRLGYMQQVLDETLRISVLAPFTARYDDQDKNLAGYDIPAGTPVLHAIGVMLKDEKLWSEPNKFDPDRFSEGKQIKPFSFVPFGFAGKRRCPGYHFTYVEATVLLSILLRRYKLQLLDEQSDLSKPHVYITLGERKE